MPLKLELDQLTTWSYSQSAIGFVWTSLRTQRRKAGTRLLQINPVSRQCRNTVCFLLNDRIINWTDTRTFDTVSLPYFWFGLNRETVTSWVKWLRSTAVVYSIIWSGWGPYISRSVQSVRPNWAPQIYGPHILKSNLFLVLLDISPASLSVAIPIYLNIAKQKKVK